MLAHSRQDSFAQSRMQHRECYTEILRQGWLTKNFFPFYILVHPPALIWYVKDISQANQKLLR